MSDLHTEPTERSSSSKWRFTRQHLMITLLIEGVLAVIGIILAVVGNYQNGDQAYRCLLTAVCVFLLQNAVVLTAILSILANRTHRPD